MSRNIKHLLYLMIIAIVVASTACASTKKNPWMEKKKEASKVHTSQLGRNKYYFSFGYQKKLVKSYKKK